MIMRRLELKIHHAITSEQMKKGSLTDSQSKPLEIKRAGEESQK
jgi:hypothetical protein